LKDHPVNRILKELCEKHKVPLELMQNILQEERNIRHLKRRRDITERLRTMIEKSIGVEK
jgi:hypothetical protein